MSSTRAGAQSAARSRTTPDHGLVPVPLTVDDMPGEPFRSVRGVRLVAGPETAAVSAAIIAATRIGTSTGAPVAVVGQDDGSPGAIVLTVTAHRPDLGVGPDLDPHLAAEAYRLDVTAERITIVALGGAGLLRGLSTLTQLSQGDSSGDFTVAPVTVIDHPRFAWRGLSLDVARHFFGVYDLEAVIDVMVGFKLNVLHLHLTDDQGWRLDLPSRPDLARLSGGTAVGGGDGGFLTAAQFAELLAFAAARYVTVVPEIEIPGHVNAALHAYGELVPSGEAAAAHTGVDLGFSRLHLDLPATRPFVHDVIGDVAAMTPGPYVHIGGDEVLTMEGDEYAALVTLAVEEVRAAGKTVVGWQEVAPVLASGGLLPAAGSVSDAVVQYWDERGGSEDVVAAALLGAKVLLSPASRVYLDMRYDRATPLGQDWAGHLDVQESYCWDPIDVLPGVPADQVVGVEAVLWTETVRTREELFLMLLPRLPAVAEVAWSAEDRRTWEGFSERLPAHAADWDDAGLTWYRSPQVPWW